MRTGRIDMYKYQCKKGIVLERKVKNLLINQGYLAIRSPRSLGLFDVWAVNKDHIRLIQIKYNQISKEEVERIRAYDNLPYNAIKEVWIYRKGEFEKMKISTNAFGELVDLFAESCKDCSPETVQGYRRTMNDYKRFLEKAHIDPFKIKTGEVRGYLTELHERELSMQTISSIVSSLRKFYTFLFRYEIVKENVFDIISNPKIPEKLVEALTEGEMNKFLDSIEDPLGAAICELLYATGVRTGELLDISCEDIDFKNGLVKVINTQGQERLLPLTSKSMKKIKAYRQYVDRPFNGHLFLNSQGHALNRDDLDKIIAKCSEASNIGKNINPKLIRSSLAVHLLNGGADLMAVKAIMGHESIESTLAYAKLSIDEKKDIVDKLSSGERIGAIPLLKNTEGFADAMPIKCRMQYRFRK